MTQLSLAGALASPRGPGSLPTSAFVQLADRCNHSCVHCYQVLGERGEMTTSEVKALLDELARGGVLFLMLSGGEVTLRPDFLEIVRYARDHRFAVRVMTNGFLVDDAMASALADLAVLEVRISVYSTRAATHDAVTRVPGSFEHVIAGVQALRRRGVRVVLAMVLMKPNADEVEDLFALARSLDCSYQIDPNIVVREDGDRAVLATRADEAALQHLAAAVGASNLRAGQGPREKALDDSPCGACQTALVSQDGTIRPCTSLPFSLGNVRETTVERAFDSETARFVRGLTWMDLPACRVCDLRGYCSRCHADALLEGGDLFGPAYTSCRWARARFHASGAPGSPDEPEIGPYEVADDGRLQAREYEREVRGIPPEVQWALVGKRPERGRSDGRVRLPLAGRRLENPIDAAVGCSRGTPK